MKWGGGEGGEEGIFSRRTFMETKQSMIHGHVAKRADIEIHRIFS
jgi:hypothetical protein